MKQKPHLSCKHCTLYNTSAQVLLEHGGKLAHVGGRASATTQTALSILNVSLPIEGPALIHFFDQNLRAHGGQRTKLSVEELKARAWGHEPTIANVASLACIGHQSRKHHHAREGSFGRLEFVHDCLHQQRHMAGARCLLVADEGLPGFSDFCSMFIQNVTPAPSHKLAVH